MSTPRVCGAVCGAVSRPVFQYLCLEQQKNSVVQNGCDQGLEQAEIDVVGLDLTEHVLPQHGQQP